MTGSSSGIGRAIARRLAEQGANLILHGRSPSQELDESSALIKDIGCKVECLTADFSDLEQLNNFLKTAWNCFYGIDILVNNAGVDVLTGELSERPFVEKLECVWQVDVRSTLIAARDIGKRMAHQLTADRPHRRSILNIGWDQAWQGMAGDSGEMFAVSKGAIMSMTKSLAQSLAPNVRVNCLAPGWIRTKWGESASDEIVAVAL